MVLRKIIPFTCSIWIVFIPEFHISTEPTAEIANWCLWFVPEGDQTA